ELAQELRVVELPQRLLVENRNPAPVLGGVEFRGIDMVELAAVPGDLLCPFECDPLSLALDFPDVVTRFRQRQREVHGYPEASSAVAAPPAKHQFAPTSRRRYCWLVGPAKAKQEICGVPQSASDMKPRSGECRRGRK